MTPFLTKLKVLHNNRFIINRTKHTHSGQHYSCDVVAVHDKLCYLCRNQHAPKINWNHNDQISEINMPNKNDYMRYIIANHIERNKVTQLIFWKKNIYIFLFFFCFSLI